MKRWIHFFDAPDQLLDLVGGKGMNLSRLVQARVSVPPGFVITTLVYRAFLDANDLEPQIQALYRDAVPDEPGSLERVANSIRRAFEEAAIPTEIATAIQQAAGDLRRSIGASAALAVRSSATAEDSVQASFAGQHDTFLNVQERDLLDQVKRCWSSLWTARAIDYRARQGVAPASASLAVVVQQMVRAEASGVVFTANPLTGARDEAVINAAWGLGDALVSGLVTPDNFVVDKRTGALKQVTLGEKLIATVPTAAGIEQQDVPTGRTRERVLNDDQLKRLVKLCCGIEADWAEPQDIEWCLQDNGFQIVQSRPITALPREPERWSAPADGLWVHGGGAMELLTEPVSPLLETLFVPLFDEALFEWMNGFGLSDALQWPIVRGVNGFMFVCLQVRLRPRHIPAMIRDFQGHMTSMERWPQEVKQYRSAVAGLSQPAPESANALDLFTRVQSLLQAALRYWIHVTMMAHPIYRVEHRFLKFYSSIRRRGEPVPEVFLRGLEMRPVEAELSVYQLAKVAEDSPGVAQLLMASDAQGLESFSGAQYFRDRLTEHLDRFGHQIYSFDPLVPTLSEDPRPVLAAVQAYLGGKEPPDARFARLGTERVAAIKEIEIRLSARRIRRFRLLLGLAQRGACLRENALFELGLAWKPMRQCLLELGRRMVAEEAISNQDDVFWLTRSELSATASNLDSGKSPESARDQVRQRRSAWRRRQGLQPPFVLPLGSRLKFWWKYVIPAPELRPQPDAGIIRGLGVSPGRVTSVARVIKTQAEMDRLHSGEILVTHTTTPGWTPLFVRAGGLVTDLGGPLTHGSIVAREYGIPAVMGTGSATQRIKDGQTITVDGTNGCVFENLGMC
jgi:phosphohistidine swiveling domain-containing protein